MFENASYKVSVVEKASNEQVLASAAPGVTDKIVAAKLQGCTGDIRDARGSLTMVRNGACLKCIT